MEKTKIVRKDWHYQRIGDMSHTRIAAERTEDKY